MGSNQLVQLKWNTHQPTLLCNLESYLNSETMVDCTLAAEGHYMRAHKVILCACSPYFQELLSVDNEKHPIIYLHNVKYTELQALLSYMYRGEININQDNVPGFLRIAESLQLHGICNSNSSSSMNSNRSKISDAYEEIKEEEGDEDEEEEEDEVGQEEIAGGHIFNNKSMSTNQISKQGRFEVFATTTKKNQNNNTSDSCNSNIIISDRKRAPTRGRRSSSSSASSTTATNQPNNNNSSINNQTQQQQLSEEMNSQLLRMRNTNLMFNDFLEKCASTSNNNNNHSHQKLQKMDQKIRTTSMTPQPLLATTTATSSSTSTSTTTIPTIRKSSILPSDSHNYHRHVINPIAYNNSPFALSSIEKSCSSSSSSSLNAPDSFDQSGAYVPDLLNNESIMTLQNESPFDENSTIPDEEEFKDDEIQDELNSGGDPRFGCIKCGKQYTSNKSLWRHRKFTCDGKQTFSCHLCGKSFSRSDNLRRHAVVAHSAQ